MASLSTANSVSQLHTWASLGQLSDSQPALRQINASIPFIEQRLSLTPKHALARDHMVQCDCQLKTHIWQSRSWVFSWQAQSGNRRRRRGRGVACSASGESKVAAPARYKRVPRLRSEIMELPIEYIIRPLQKTRSYDPEKVQGLADSIAEIGLQEPIDVIEVDGQYYGFSGCHRFEAHQLLGKPTIKCSVRKGTQKTLRDHLS